MDKLPELMTQHPRIWFGDYCISPFDDDQFVLEHKSGEAAVIDKTESGFNDYIESMFKNYF